MHINAHACAVLAIDSSQAKQASSTAYTCCIHWFVVNELDAMHSNLPSASRGLEVIVSTKLVTASNRFWNGAPLWLILRLTYNTLWAVSAYMPKTSLSLWLRQCYRVQSPRQWNSQMTIIELDACLHDENSRRLTPGDCKQTFPTHHRMLLEGKFDGRRTHCKRYRVTAGKNECRIR